MKNGILLGKLQSLEETLNELRTLGRVTSAQLQQDWRTRRAIERDLQADIINNRLADFDLFRDEVLRFCRHENPT